MRDRLIYELARIISDHERIANAHELDTDPYTASFLAEVMGIKNEVSIMAEKLAKMYS